MTTTLKLDQISFMTQKILPWKIPNPFSDKINMPAQKKKRTKQSEQRR